MQPTRSETSVASLDDVQRCERGMVTGEEGVELRVRLAVPGWSVRAACRSSRLAMLERKPVSVSPSRSCVLEQLVQVRVRVGDVRASRARARCPTPRRGPPASRGTRPTRCAAGSASPRPRGRSRASCCATSCAAWIAGAAFGRVEDRLRAPAGCRCASARARRRSAPLERIDVGVPEPGMPCGRYWSVSRPASGPPAAARSAWRSSAKLIA